jgi:hypothetical protein
MKTAFFSSHILWDTHYETELEVMQHHLDAGDEVYQYVCNAEMTACDVNPDHAFSRCVQCVAKRRHGRSLLSLPVPAQSYRQLSDADIRRIDAFMATLPLELEAFKALRFDHFDVGYAVVSSIVSQLENPKPDIRANRLLFERFTRAALEVYLSFMHRLQADRPDRLYIFNGRLAQVKGAFRAAQACGIPCHIHERGNTFRLYGIFEDHLPHDIKRMGEKMATFWENEADEAEKEKQAAYFFENRRKGVLLSWKSFTDKQVKGLLPDGFDPSKKNIMIFNSSEFEFASIGPEWDNTIYRDQNDGVTRICADMAAHPDYHFYLRLHPNLATADPANYEKVRQLQAPNLTVIMPEAPIDSYHLLDAAWKVITFGSTMGMEATWWGKPSIMAGHCLYERFDSIYKPKDHQALLELLLDPDLPPCDKEDARKFGYFYAAYGHPYKYYEPTDYKSGTYRGVNLEPKMDKDEKQWMERYWKYRRFALLRKPLERMILRKLND